MEQKAVATEKMAALYAALAKARAKFPTIPRSRTVSVTMKSGGRYTFAYAPLDEILNAVVPPLSAEGLAIVQLAVADGLTTRLVHADGGSIEVSTPLPRPEDTGPKAYGSVLTYARRYALSALLCIAPEDDDDSDRAESDGVRMPPPPASVYATPADVRAIQEAAKAAGLSRDDVHGLASRVCGRDVQSSTMVLRDEVGQVIEAIKAAKAGAR